MTLLTVVQDFCTINGLATTNIVISSPDATVQQLLGVTNDCVELILDQSGFQAYTYEAVFTTLPQEDQGSIYDLGNQGLLSIYSNTLFDRTLRRPLYGPVSAEDWQALKALPNPGPFYKYRIRQDRFLINPVPTVPYSIIAFEYASSFGVKDSLGVPKAVFTADDDTFVLPERLLKRALTFRWKQIKGLPYQSDEAAFYAMLNNYIARDKTKPRIDMAGGNRWQVRPGIFVPSGTWPV